MAITTGRSGLSAAQTVYIYAPPNVANIARGATVSYGPWLTLEEGQALPGAPVVVELQAGSAPLQAANQVVWRTVTIT